MNLKPQTVNKLRKLVRNYNNKINRVKINKPEISDIQPEKKSIRTVLKDINSLADYNRIVNDLKNYTKKGSENPYITEQNVVITNYEKNRIDRIFARINRERKKEIETYNLKDGFGMGLPTASDLAPKANLIESIKYKDWDKFVQGIERNRYNMNISQRAVFYKNNMLKAIENVFGKGELYSKVNQLSGTDLVSLYYKIPYFNIDFIYEPQEQEEIEYAFMTVIDNETNKRIAYKTDKSTGEVVDEFEV